MYGRQMTAEERVAARWIPTPHVEVRRPGIEAVAYLAEFDVGPRWAAMGFVGSAQRHSFWHLYLSEWERALAVGQWFENLEASAAYKAERRQARKDRNELNRGGLLRLAKAGRLEGVHYMWFNGMIDGHEWLPAEKRRSFKPVRIVEDRHQARRSGEHDGCLVLDESDFRGQTGRCWRADGGNYEMVDASDGYIFRIRSGAKEGREP